MVLSLLQALIQALYLHAIASLQFSGYFQFPDENLEAYRVSGVPNWCIAVRGKAGQPDSWQGLSGFLHTSRAVPYATCVGIAGNGMHRGRWLVSQLHRDSLRHSHLPEQPSPALSAFKFLLLLQATLTLATSNG